MSKPTTATTKNKSKNSTTTTTTTYTYYDQNKANLIRLKVNKVNLVQQLDPDDEMITKLINSKALSYDEAAAIMSGRSREEKAKSLVNTLIGKNEMTASQQSINSTASSSRCRSFKKDWYYQFRKVLADKGYSDLVIFLDNTIINKPKFVEKFSSMTMANQRGEENYSHNSIDEDLKSILKPPQVKSFKYKTKASYIIDELKSSKDPNDLKQLTAELEALENFKELEKISVNSLASSSSSSSVGSSASTLAAHDNPTAEAAAMVITTGEFILDTPVVRNILDLADMHLYIKYFKQFNDAHRIDFLKVFCTLMVDSFTKDRIIRLRFYANLDELVHKLAWMFIRNERPKLAEEMLAEYLNYIDFLENYVERLNKENNSNKTRNFNDNSRFILLISKLNTLSNLIIVKNALSDFSSSLALYKSAKELLGLANQYEMEINTTILFYGIANTYYELGNFDKAASAINKSLLTICYENDLLIEILGTASLIYSLNWHLKEAENFAILAVQSARAIYGVNHSQFVRALLHYCYFSNEFIQDESSINACKYTLGLAKKVYGCNCLSLADAYRSLSKALTVNKYFKEDIYFEYAQKSLKIANELLSFEQRDKKSMMAATTNTSNPRLIPFKLAFVSVLQWRSINSNDNDTKQSNLNEAYNLAIDALKTCMNLLGQVNVYTAKIYRFIGSLLYYMERDSDSEKIHKKSVEILESILTPQNFHCLLAKSTLGVFYKMVGSVDYAISCLLDVISYLKHEDIETIVSYCKWIPSVYTNLSECYRVKKIEDLANNYQKQAESMKMMAFKKPSSTNSYEIDFEMYRNPPSDLNDYLKELIK